MSKGIDVTDGVVTTSMADDAYVNVRIEPVSDKYLNIDKVDGGWLLTTYPGMKRSVATSATGLADAVKKWAQGDD